MLTIRHILTALASFTFLTACDKAAQNVEIITLEATDIKPTSATVSGQAILPDRLSTDFSVGIMYSTSSGVLSINSTVITVKDINADYSFSVKLSSLSPELTYYYRSFITENGVNTYGETKSFTTLPEKVITLPEIWSSTGGSKTVLLSGVYDGYSVETPNLEGYGFAFSHEPIVNEQTVLTWFTNHQTAIDKDGSFSICLNRDYHILLDGPYYCAFIEKKDKTCIYGNTRKLEQ